MQTDKISSVIELLGISPESPVSIFIEGLAEHIPYIGKVISAIKMHRLQLRVKKLEERLSNLSFSMNENENRLLNEFIKKKAFPITLDTLLEEHEEEKIDLIMNGLEYVYKEEIREESKILVYFDVLRDLRVEEIKKLLEYSEKYRKLGWKKKQNKAKFHPENPTERIKHFENQGYNNYIINHLEKLGLLDTGLRNLEDTAKEIYSSLNKAIESRYGNRAIKSEVKLTPFGINFIKFFDLTCLIQLPAE